MHSVTILAVFGRYVWVRIQPPLTDELVRMCLAGAVTLVNQAGAGQILGILFDLQDTQTTDSASVMNGFLQSNWEKYRMYTQAWLAVVITLNDCHLDYSEIISSKAGLPVRFFNQERSAMEWLKENEPF